MSEARAAGHAAAIAQAASHAAHAANYAAKAASFASAAAPTDPAAATKERDWQYRRLPEHLRPVAFPARGNDGDGLEGSLTAISCQVAAFGFSVKGLIETRRGALKGKEEGGTLPDLALGPHPATVPVDDALHRGQSYPRTLEFTSAVQALEGSEEFVSIGHVEPYAVVPYVVRRCVLVL
jgi:hypothetical protein